VRCGRALTRLRNGSAGVVGELGWSEATESGRAADAPRRPVVPSSRPSEGVRGLARPGVEHRSVRDATSKSTLCRSAEGVCR
jgi:hypothetical protein